MSSVLRLEQLTKNFIQGGKELAILKGIDLSLNRGSFTALVGASGSGKSTLLQIAGLLDSPTTGQVSICGHNFAQAPDNERTKARRQNLGFVYQFHHLLPDFTALENVAMAGLIQGQSKSNALAEARELLAHMGLEARLGHKPGALSGGEQQRVAIARALMGAPLLLLADEPTGNLDEEAASRVFHLFKAMAQQKNISVLMATHDRDLAAQADQRYELKLGHIHPF